MSELSSLKWPIKGEKDGLIENSLAKSERELEELNNEIEKLTKEIQQKAKVALSIRIKANETKSGFIRTIKKFIGTDIWAQFFNCWL
ncbi:7268_t:CDS:2 [Funneliformis caledonium]|uniref:7268_t:CDS:1 n=1 Tax=Funneliformis caledonium TaxID=1117310 RepID=A0A9N9DEA8_9GLOM|nr:7268_t:CDS:2 [Funneliformis caledonium]